MSNPTSNFGWVMPTSTDLVTDLPADFAVFGQGVDTSMAQLKGGTTGQILSKTSATDMAFTWITPNPGDITAVNVTSPITGGGTSGDVTIGIQAGSTTQSGAVQLTDSTASTSTTTAATPNSVKTSYDLAAAAIPKSTVTTSGDIIYATGASAVTRRAIGTTGQVLTVSGGLPTWADATGASMTLISTTTLTGSSQVNLTSIPSTYKALRLIISGAYPAASGYLRFLLNNDTTNPAYAVVASPNARNSAFNFSGLGTPYADTFYTYQGSGTGNSVILDIPNYTGSNFKYVTASGVTRQASTSTYDFGVIPFFYNGTGTISQINILYSGTTFSAGTAYLYGVN